MLILAGSRLPFAMAEGGGLPRVVSATHRRFRTPYVSILITAAVMLALTLPSNFYKQVNLSVIARLLSYGLTCAALLVLRRKSDAPSPLFKAPAGVAVAVTALVLSAWLLSNSTQADARDSAIAAVAGLLIYAAYKLVKRFTCSDAKRGG